MNQSDQINELAKALCAAQGLLGGAKKDAANPFFKSRYADLESVWEACRKVLPHHGLSVAQTTDVINGQCVLVTSLLHDSGQWIRGIYPIHPIKDDPQGMGSAITYARRYALAAIVGVYQTDDDAEAAMRRPLAQASPGPLGAPNPPQTARPGVPSSAGPRPVGSPVDASVPARARWTPRGD